MKFFGAGAWWTIQFRPQTVHELPICRVPAAKDSSEKKRFPTHPTRAGKLKRPTPSTMGITRRGFAGISSKPSRAGRERF